MIVRKLEQKDHGKTRALYEEVFFEDSKGFVDYYYSEKTKDNVIYIVEEDGKICSMLHLNPYTISLKGRETKSYYIVAVATKKEYRKRGFMRALLAKALEDMYEEGILFTYLMPAAEAIYTPYDFRTVYEQTKVLTKGSEKGELVLEEDLLQLADMANSYLKEHYQLFAKRDVSYYTRLLKEYASENVEVFWRKDGDTVKEVWAKMQETNGKAPKIMIRIVDVRKMLMCMSVRMLTAACFTITDPWIEENNRCLSIIGTEFSGLTLMDSEAKNSEGTIPVSALSAFLFGAISVEELSKEKGVTMTERLKGELSKFIPISDIYLNEVV